MRLDRADIRFLVICLIVSAVCGFVGVRYYDQVFPEASITFSVDRSASEQRARDFLAQRGISLSGQRHAAAFQYDEEAKTFLERELGAERAGALADGPLRLWQWVHRWFTPLQKEEVLVSITTRGELAGFHHQIAEDAPGAKLSEAQARALAEEFLAAVWPRGRALEFVVHSEQQRPARLDHTFEWKEPAHSGAALLAGRDLDAQFRVQVLVQGGRVDGYTLHLKLPEAWERDYQRMRSRNQLTSLVDLGLNLFLVVGLLVVLVQRARAGDVPWRFAVRLAMVGGVFALLAALNQFQMAVFSYDTTKSWGSFLGQFGLSALVQVAGLFAIYLILTAGSEPLYRQRRPSHIALPNLFTARGFRSKSFLLQIVLGLTLAFFFFAYENAFYLVALKLGAWSPRDVPYDNILNSSIPWAFVISFAFTPAVTEEFIWRLFAIPFLWKLTRSPLIAIVVPAFLWGFGHAAYPQQPFWIRGVEVGIAGIVTGIIMLRFGILPTLVWHYTADALYSALVLLKSGSPYLVASGAISSGIMLLPLVIAAYLYARRGRFDSEEGIRNMDVGASPPPSSEIAEATSPASGSVVGAQESKAWHTSVRALVAAAAVGALFWGVRLIPLSYWGEFVRFRLSPSEAIERAKAFLRERGLKADTSKNRVAIEVSDLFGPRVRPASPEGQPLYLPPPSHEPYAAQYVLQHAGTAVANRQYGDLLRAATYTVRFFQPREIVEDWIEIDTSTGAVAAYERRIDETATGADLSAEAARPLADRALNDVGFRPSAFVVKERETEKRKGRTDHRFVYEATDPSLLAGEARPRIAVEIQGDQLGKIERWEYVPEQWVRQREGRSAIDAARKILRFAVLGALYIGMATLLIFRIRAGQVRWRAPIIAAGVLAAGTLVTRLLALPNAMVHYPTSMDLSLFYSSLAVGQVVAGPLLVFVSSTAGFALLLSLYPEVLEAWGASNRALLLKRSAWAAMATLLFLGGLRQLGRFVQALAAGLFPIDGLSFPSGMASLVPGLGFLGGSLLQTANALLVVGVLAYLAEKHLRGAGPQLIALVIGAAILVPEVAVKFNEWSAGFFQNLIAIVGAWVVVRWVLRKDLFAYVCLGLFAAGGSRAVELLAEPSAYSRLQGLIPLAFTLGLFLLIVGPTKLRPMSFPSKPS